MFSRQYFIIKWKNWKKNSKIEFLKEEIDIRCESLKADLDKISEKLKKDLDEQKTKLKK